MLAGSKLLSLFCFCNSIYSFPMTFYKVGVYRGVVDHFSFTVSLDLPESLALFCFLLFTLPSELYIWFRPNANNFHGGRLILCLCLSISVLIWITYLKDSMMHCFSSWIESQPDLYITSPGLTSINHAYVQICADFVHRKYKVYLFITSAKELMLTSVF